MPTVTVKDVTDATFTADVIEASSTRPVVVDFWAPWCGPCHQLSPLLEDAADRYAGEVDLVKVNVDESPALAQAFRVQGIPAVKAIRDGRLVAEFVGAQPAAVVDQLFASLAPSPADRIVAAAAPLDEAGREAAYREALELVADHREAVLGLAGMLSSRGQAEDATALLARLPSDPDAQRLQAEIALAGQARDEEGLADLRARVAAGDEGAAVELGEALAAAGRHDEGVQLLLGALADPDARDGARLGLLEVFRVLGADPRVPGWRRQMAAALF